MKKLGEVCDIKSSKRVHKVDWREKGVPFYRAREIVKLAENGFVNNVLFISKNLFEEFTKLNGSPKEGDIVVSAVGTLGRCYRVKKEDKFYFKDASVLWFDNFKNINSKYVEYLFLSELVKKQVMNKSMGATVGTLTITRAKNIQIPLPPLPEQIRITKILDETFGKLEIAKKNAEKNLKNAK
ncbi:MAG: restriction endonuclease subunit S, partial [Flavobacteriaceae bacterium]|nr:restriction endonuclease subunit S [Flavobacteriaceae bacterium]